MGVSCCAPVPPPKKGAQEYRTALWAVLAINAVMFAVEIVAGLSADSASLQADAIDFLGDAANYGLSLFVIGMAAHWRAKAALLKGLTMGVFGAWVAVVTVWHLITTTVPQAETMGVIGAIALVANAVSFLLLWRYRAGDANMRSAWICSRNDVIGNMAVLLAAAGVFGTAQGWPDAVVAGIMSGLALQGAWVSVRLALAELKSAPPAAAAGT